VFATKLMGPRILTCVESPSHSLFLACSGEKYEKHKKPIYNTYNQQQRICGNEIKKNSLLGIVALCARMRTSLSTSPMLSINCPISHKHLVLTPPQLSHSTSYTHTCDIFQASRRRNRLLEIFCLSGILWVAAKYEIMNFRDVKFFTPFYVTFEC
jgi:hypothetical protein